MHAYVRVDAVNRRTWFLFTDLVLAHKDVGGFFKIV